MDPVRINEEHEQCTADSDRREHGYSDTKAEREGEPLHRRTAQEEEDAGGDDDCHIRIKDGDKCTFEAGLDSQPKHPSEESMVDRLSEQPVNAKATIAI